MACQNHPDRDAAAACVTCGVGVCDECRQVGADGKPYCAEHLPALELPPRGASEKMAGTPGESLGLAAAGYFSWVVTPLSFVLPIISLASADMKQSRFMRYHAYNGLFWGIAVVAVFIVLQIALWFAGLVRFPWLLMMPLRIVRLLWGLGVLVASIIFAIRASGRQTVRIPLISDLADSQAK